jgi:hypothetical protein
VIVPPVDDGDLDRFAAERLGAGQASESGTDDDHVEPIF